MKIMIADSSAVVRTILEQNLLKYEQMQITASVSSCKKILLSLESEKADVIICGNDITDDTEKESVNKICKELKIPVLLLCSSDINYSKNTYTEIMEKPNLKNYTSDFFERLKDNLHKLTVKQQKPKAILASDNNKTSSYKILCSGAST